ncbi:putative ribonuclease H-like domain-containing protein [Tanacetum coccineum]|uniref:Ribonuclease H-like domain-containing protein n=1 Tax=Tanacetum coccineum TaxID=301880 RepID=A0ABQ4X472_9ASTR
MNKSCMMNLRRWLLKKWLLKLWMMPQDKLLKKKRGILHLKKRQLKTTSINKLSTGRPSVSTATTPYLSAASTPTCANAGESSFVYLGGKIPIDASTLPNADLPIDPNMPDLEDDSHAFSSDGIFNRSFDDENVGAVADFNNMDDTINVSPIPTLRIHKNHLKDQILGDPKSVVQTRGKIQKASSAQQALVSYISKHNRFNHKDHQNCLLACFLSQEEPKNISQALQDESWVEAMQEKLPTVLTIEGLVLIEAIRLFLAFASYMGFAVYQMDVKSAFLYGTIEEEVYVHQPPGFVDHAYPNKVYKVIKALYGLHQALRAWYETLSSFLMENGFRREFDVVYAHKYPKSSMGELTSFWGLQVKLQPQSVVANSILLAEYVAAANYCGQVLWIHNQMMDYGFNFMNTRIHIDNESTISVIKNPVAHSRTKHIEIRFHFIRDCYEKRLIEVIKIHTDSNVADLLTKGFDVTRFNFLVVSIGMLNL